MQRSFDSHLPDFLLTHLLTYSLTHLLTYLTLNHLPFIRTGEQERKKERARITAQKQPVPSTPHHLGDTSPDPDMVNVSSSGSSGQ